VDDARTKSGVKVKNKAFKKKQKYKKTHNIFSLNTMLSWLESSLEESSLSSKTKLVQTKQR
jgi:hypothetical protein